ncbi:MAG: sigma 54-dependent Fis family transcriptional regulator [Deltaproteobacteria bacterium]|nr:MAG: sigma 54-dependent Fis family transcriptional regulator [Deltaproteobacteria bacterium]
MYSKSKFTTELVDYNQLVNTPQGPQRSWLTVDAKYLVVTEGPHAGDELALEEEVSRIGRGDWCNLSLPRDTRVSTEHCEILLEKQGVRIRDLGSRNGTILNGCPVFDAYIIEGATLLLGDSKLELRSRKANKRIPISYQDESGLLFGKSPEMRKIFSLLGRLAKRDVVTLLTGETGTGKTSVARAIHEQSHRKDGKFVSVNCGALHASLIEDALFGHEKGAFTGADSTHQGFFEQANGGTLFLDEVAELPIDLQPKLLDVIERRKIRRLGSETEIGVDFRLLTATHRNLREEIENGKFREDLFFRLSVVELKIPSLRERPEDILLLVDMFLKELSPDQEAILTEDAQQALRSYLWPGNIRQLRNVLERSVVFLEGNRITRETLSLPNLEQATPETATPETAAEPVADDYPTFTMDSNSPRLPFTPMDTAIDTPALGTELQVTEDIGVQLRRTLRNLQPNLKEVLTAFEKVMLEQALQETENNVLEASDMLGISQAWLYNRMKKYGIKKKRDS